ncbi:MAG: tetratricopeptide repeat protein, partial [Myxococcota bacterium]
DLSVLFEYFSSLRTRFIVTSRQFSVHYPALGPFLRNLNVKSILSGSTTFEDALRSDDSRAIELSQLLYFLLVTDMVKPQARPGEMPEELKEDIAVGSSSPAEAVDYRELARVSERIASEYLRLKDVDFFAALGLDHDADDNAIDRAFNEACAAFRYDRLPPGLGDDMLRKVREIIEILSRARVTLKDKAKRRGYEKESKVAAVMSFLEDDEPVPMDDNSRADALYQAGQGLLAEARFSEARVKFQEAIASFSHAARYWVALAQATLLDGHGEAATTDALNCLRRAYEAEPGDIAANFELAKLLLRVGQPQAARGHLQQVVERAPDHAEARRMLAQI